MYRSSIFVIWLVLLIVAQQYKMFLFNWAGKSISSVSWLTGTSEAAHSVTAAGISATIPPLFIIEHSSISVYVMVINRFSSVHIRLPNINQVGPSSAELWRYIDFCRAMLCISAAYAVMRCLSVCLSVSLSRSCILSKRTNISSNFFHHRVATPF